MSITGGVNVMWMLQSYPNWQVGQSLRAMPPELKTFISSMSNKHCLCLTDVLLSIPFAYL